MGTVRLNVEVSIDWKDPDYDTGLTVDEWNAMTPDERSQVKENAWQVATQNDSGGIWPTTEGATHD